MIVAQFFTLSLSYKIYASSSDSGAFRSKYLEEKIIIYIHRQTKIVTSLQPSIGKGESKNYSKFRLITKMEICPVGGFSAVVLTLLPQIGANPGAWVTRKNIPTWYEVS